MVESLTPARESTDEEHGADGARLLTRTPATIPASADVLIKEDTEAIAGKDGTVLEATGATEATEAATGYALPAGDGAVPAGEGAAPANDQTDPNCSELAFVPHRQTRTPCWKLGLKDGSVKNRDARYATGTVFGQHVWRAGGRRGQDIEDLAVRDLARPGALSFNNRAGQRSCWPANNHHGVPRVACERNVRASEVLTSSKKDASS